MELKRQTDHFAAQKKKWMCWYYLVKMVVILLGAAIPVAATLDATTGTLAVMGGLIAVSESSSQLWHFHDRYLAAREMQKGLERERIQFETKSGDYGPDAENNEKLLGDRVTGLFDGYQSQVLGVLRVTRPAADKHSSSGQAAHLSAGNRHDI
jgi:hypothetical protein